MSENAEKIAGRVLSKLATSKWREMVRSGALSQRESEALKRSLGFTEDRMTRGLTQKWLNIAERMGYVPLTSRGGSVGIPGATPQEMAKRVDPTSLRSVRAYAGRREGPMVAPDVKTPYTYVPHYSEVNPAGKNFWEEIGADIQGKKDWSKLSPRTRKALTGWGAGHEASEMLYTGKLSPDRVFPEWKGTTHASPRVVLEELRDARMMSPEVQRYVRGLRTHSGAPGAGEMYDIAMHVPPHARTNRLYLPRKELARYSKSISKGPSVTTLMRDPTIPRKDMLKWFDKLLRRVGRLR